MQNSPNIKTVDPKLSGIIQEWMQGQRSRSLMQYVVDKGYRVPMTAATYTVDYSAEFIDRIKKNGYFDNNLRSLTKIGIGVIQKDWKLEIMVVYM